MKKRIWFVVLVFVLLAIAGVGGWAWLSNRQATTPIPELPRPQGAETAVPDFDHIVIIVMENEGYGNIIGQDSQAPYLNQLASRNSLASNYYANFHPSLPNYIAMTSGTNAGIADDCNPPGGDCLAHVKNIADEIENSNRSWKAYQESMPSACTTHNAGRYAVKHNPFVYYPDVLHNADRCRDHVVPYTQLAKDLASHDLPNYVFITPDMCHDMHDCSIRTGDSWLAEQVPVLLGSYAFTEQNSLLVVTFDEAGGYDRQNKIPTILVGKSVKRSYDGKGGYSHYSLLRTVEKAWGLDRLTDNDTNAPVMTEFFK